MAKVRTREEALLNAYLNRYQNAQASTVSSGQSAQQNAQSKGSALMNSTDKSLPEVKDYSSDIYNGIISSAKQDNELTTAAMKQYQKEQEAAAKEAEKAAKAAAKSSKKTGGSKKSGSKSGSTTGSESDDTDVSAAVNALLGGNTETAGTETKSGTSKKSVVTAKSGAAAQAERNASARAKYSGSTQQKKDTEDSKKLAAAREKDAEYIRNQKIKRMLNEKKNGSPGKAGTSYAERQNAAQGAQSRAVTSTGQQVGSSYAAAGQAPTESERTAGAKIKQQTADALKKLQNDKDYLAELAKPGRKLTQSEIQAVKQYGKNANDLYKEYQNGDISIAEYNQQAQNLTRLNQKASMNGLGQDMQAFTSGLMTSAPFLQQTDNAVKSLGGDTYRKAIEDGVIPDTLNALQGYQDQNKLAAAAGTMAGKSAQYATFNNLMEGTPLADTMGKVGGKVMGAASSIPVLGRFATPAAGEALGRILTDQTADTALDTIPSLINDLSTYDEQQGRIKSGEQVDDALTPGRIGLNVLGNVGQNFAMNALTEIGGAVVNGIKDNRMARQMLAEQAQGVENGLNAEDAKGLVDAYKGLQNGDFTTHNIDALNGSMESYNDWDNYVPALRQDLQDAAAEPRKAAQQARDAALSLAKSPADAEDVLTAYDTALGNLPSIQNQAMTRDTANWKRNDLTQSENLPVDNAAWLVQNEVTGGIANGTTDLGGTVPADIPVLSDSGKRLEPQPGENGIGVSGAAGTGREAAGAAGNGARAAADGAADSTSLAGWASAVTGKDRRSQLTRRVEALGERIANGESRESLLQEANDIAARLVKESDFAEPADEATLGLRDYLKNTPIRLDEQAAWDILYSSGLKSLSQYNIQNGTNFSTTKGLDFDAALQELNGMNVGLNGDDGVNALMDAVAKSKEKPVVDTVYASAYTDYVRDYLLDGVQKEGLSDEGFMDWLDAQSFDRDAPDYVQQMNARINDYAPWDDADTGIPVLNQTDNAADVQSVPALERQAAESTARPLNGSESVPENAIGANSTQYDRREVPNLDYANQQRFNSDLDADEVQKLAADQNTHTLYTMKESADNAKLNFDTYLQGGDGSISTATDNVLKDLRSTERWNADDIALAKEAAEQQRNVMALLDKGSAEYEVEFAKYKQLDRQTSRGLSEAGRTMREGVGAEQTADTGIRKFNQITQKITDKYADTRAGKSLQDVAEVVYDGKVDEFLTQVAKEQGIDEAMAEAEKQIRKAAESRHVKLKDDEIKKAAASMLAGGDADDMFDALARTRLNIGDFTDEDYSRIRNIFTETSGMKDSKARYNLESEAYAIMSKYLPAKTFADKWNNLRYLAMLGNTRTHCRNILGNISMSAVTRTKDNVSAVMQLAIPQNERTKAIGTTWTKQGRNLVDGAKKYIDTDAYTLLYNDGKYNVQNGLAGAQKTYGSSPLGKLLQWASDKNSGLLEKEDAYFLKEAYANSMASFLKARGADSSIFNAGDSASKDLLLKASAQALEDAKEATFHEDNFLTTALKNFSNDTKNAGAGGKIAYAITEGILPFKKTPINIAKNALEYSGGGFVEAGYRALKGESKARVIDAAAKGVTGVSAIGIGFLLGRSGLLNGGATGDDRKDNYNEMTGRQDYSVTLPNGGTYTIDWASPAAIPLMIGAEIAQDNSGLTVGGLLDKLSRFSNPILETTMLQGLNDTLESLQYSDNPLWDLGASAIGSYFGQSVPTLSGQIARTVDPLRRSTYGGGQSKTERDRNYSARKAESRIPGLSKKLEPYIDQWGREESSLDGTDESAAGTALRGVYNFLSPGYYSGQNETAVDDYLKGLYGETNDSKVFPDKASSKLTLDKETYYMTPQEKTEYARTSGQTAYTIVDELRQNEMFLQLPEEQQAELVQKGYSVAKTVGGVAAVGDGVRGTDSKEYNAYQDGGTDGLINYMLAKNAVDVAKGDADNISKTDKWKAISSTLSGDAAAKSYVLQNSSDETAARIYDAAGEAGLSAYMDAYGKASAGLEDGKTPSKKQMTAALLQSNLNGTDLAKTYLSAYKDDEKAATMYAKYGTDGLKSWLLYTSVADLDGNGSVSKTEATKTLDSMGLTEELKRAYLTNTNKKWKNPY